MICVVPRPRRKPRQVEHQHQKALVRWAEYSGRVKYPELEMLCAVPNGGERNVIVAAKLKAEGLRRGFPDLMLLVPRGGYHGCFIELKAPGGRVQPHQQEWITRLQKHGYFAAVAWGWESARTMIEVYLMDDEGFGITSAPAPVAP